MKKSSLAIFLILAITPLFADGVGIFHDSEDGYLAVSDLYPVDSVLSVTDMATGNEVDVLVKEKDVLPPDRSVLLNDEAANALGIDEEGFAECNIVVKKEAPGEEELYDSAWSSFLIGPFSTNEEAYSTYSMIKGKGIRLVGERKDDGIYLIIRYITLFERQRIRSILEENGLQFEMGPEENPYI